MALTQTVSYCYIMAVPTTQRGQADEKLIHASSYNPRSMGLAERSVRSVKEKLKIDPVGAG